MVHWSKKLFSPRLQGSCAVKCQLKHVRLQWQLRYKGVEKIFHPTGCKSCPFFVYCLQHSSMVIWKIAVNPPCLLLTGWAKISSYSQNEQLPLNTERGTVTSAELEPYPQFTSKGSDCCPQPTAWHHWGLRLSPDLPLGWPKQGQAELRTALLQEQDPLLDQIFPLKSCVGFISGSIHCVHSFLLQAAASHFTPLWFWFLHYLLMLPSKGCNWYI